MLWPHTKTRVFSNTDRKTKILNLKPKYYLLPSRRGSATPRQAKAQYGLLTEMQNIYTAKHLYSR